MRVAIYAKYSSENQRPESIEDPVGTCRRLAVDGGFRVLEDHIYADQVQSGARRDREGLGALVAAAQSEQFDVVLVDDLSRLARDNYLMLSVTAELHFESVRVVSVADGRGSDDEEATLGIQIRGIEGELQLRDLEKKTLRGQMGQKARGFSVGERTFGYKSVPVGKIQMDKKGRPRPEGYKMEIEPREAAIVLRIFKAYADGLSLTRIVRMLNEEKIPGRMRKALGWSPATVSRILDNEKYVGRWVWNKTESRRDPRTGRRRRFTKPEPSGSSTRTMPSASCQRPCGHRFGLAETIILDAVREQLCQTEHIRYLLERVEAELAELYTHIPETVRTKEAELGGEERRLANFVDLIGEGRGSLALGKALVETERRVDTLREELDGLRRSREKVFQAPPVEWIEERLAGMREVLERRTERSALLLRSLLGEIRLKPTKGEIGRPYYVARTSLDALSLLKPPPSQDDPDGGSNSLRWWRRRESNPRPHGV